MCTWRRGLRLGPRRITEHGNGMDLPHVPYSYATSSYGVILFLHTRGVASQPP